MFYVFSTLGILLTAFLFLPLFFFISLEVRARCCEGENANIGNSKISLSSSFGVLKDRVLERLVKLMVLERGCAVERH